jgi:Na+/H+ antiporter NhaA
VALFIADLAFENQELQDIAVVAIIAASIVSALLSTLIFKAYRSNPRQN